MKFLLALILTCIMVIPALAEQRGDVSELEQITVFPGSHFVTSKERLAIAMRGIKEELIDRLEFLGKEDRLVEQQRLEQRTEFDLEMISELGYCNGIENYSRYLTGRKPGEPPPCLLDYFPSDFVLFADEPVIFSHHSECFGPVGRKLS